LGARASGEEMGESDVELRLLAEADMLRCAVVS
jgi:hypothetical protein